MLMRMDLETLRWFQQVADGVTVTEVADVYGLSQPGVSRALARLEAEVGTPLLHKSGRVLRPTHAGTVFKRHVDAAVHSLDDALAAVSQLVDPSTGTVVVAFQLSLGTWLVPDMIGQFLREYPRVQFELEQSHDALGSSPLAGGGIDLEFTAQRHRDPAVQWRRLFAQPLYLAVHPGHRLAGRAEAHLVEVSHDDFVMLRPGWDLRTLSDNLCAAAGFSPRVTFECDDLSVVQGFVASGLGVAIVPPMDAGPEPSGPATVWLTRLMDVGAHRDVGLAWAQARRLLPSAELFRQHVLTTRYGSRR